MAKHRFDADGHYLGWVHDTVEEHPGAAEVVSASPLPEQAVAASVRRVAGGIEFRTALTARSEPTVRDLVAIVLEIHDEQVKAGADLSRVAALVARLRGPAMDPPQVMAETEDA